MNKMNTILVKPVSADCDLACVYCFYHNRPADPYHLSRPHQMSNETLSSLVSQVMEIGEPVSFCWQGGEPMLAGLDFFKKVVELEKKFGSDGQVISNSLQTNGVLMDKRWISFFKEFNVFIGLSLDGPREIHDRYRKYPSGRGSFQRVMEAVNLLKENNIEFNVLSVVSKANVDKVDELYDFYTNNGLSYLQFLPCLKVNESKNEIAPFSITSKEYESFLERLFDLWFNKGDPQVHIRFFENILMTYLGMESEICWFKKKCGSYIVVEYNGDVYPCDFLVERGWFLGNLRKMSLDEILENNKFKKFTEIKTLKYPECMTCRYKSLYNQGCPRWRIVAAKIGQRGNYLCSAYKNFALYSESKFEILAKRIKYSNSPIQMIQYDSEEKSHGNVLLENQ